jgi:hypothetical protein
VGSERLEVRGWSGCEKHVVPTLVLTFIHEIPSRREDGVRREGCQGQAEVLEGVGDGQEFEQAAHEDGGADDAIAGVQGKGLVGLEWNGLDPVLEVDAQPSVGQRMAGLFGGAGASRDPGLLGDLDVAIAQARETSSLLRNRYSDIKLAQDNVPGPAALAGDAPRRGHEQSDLAHESGVAGGMSQIAVAGNPVQQRLPILRAVYEGGLHRAGLLASIGD